MLNDALNQTEEGDTTTADRWDELIGAPFKSPYANQGDTMNLGPREMDKLVYLWEFHRCTCNHQGDACIELRSGGGIGTVVVVICGCGKEIDVTDYNSW